jgi:hypothetical protein
LAYNNSRENNSVPDILSIVQAPLDILLYPTRHASLLWYQIGLYNNSREKNSVPDIPVLYR